MSPRWEFYEGLQVGGGVPSTAEANSLKLGSPQVLPGPPEYPAPSRTSGAGTGYRRLKQLSHHGQPPVARAAARPSVSHGDSDSLGRTRTLRSGWQAQVAARPGARAPGAVTEELQRN
eukprot:746068-Hanusia_phi.AAC.2